MRGNGRNLSDRGNNSFQVAGSGVLSYVEYGMGGTGLGAGSQAEITALTRCGKDWGQNWCATWTVDRTWILFQRIIILQCEWSSLP